MLHEFLSYNLSGFKATSSKSTLTLEVTMETFSTPKSNILRENNNKKKILIMIDTHPPFTVG